MTSATLAPASGLARLTALGVDLCCTLAPVLLALYVGWLNDAALSTPPGWFRSEWLLKLWLDSPGLLTAPPLWWVILSAAWFTGWQVAVRATPGALFMGLAIVDRHGLPPSRMRLLARALLSSLNVLTLGLGWMWIWPSRHKRTLPDILAGTWVVR